MCFAFLGKCLTYLLCGCSSGHSKLRILLANKSVPGASSAVCRIVRGQSIQVDANNPRWTAPEVLRDGVLGPAGDGELGSFFSEFEC